MESLRNQLYKTKVQFVAVLLAALGIALVVPGFLLMTDLSLPGLLSLVFLNFGFAVLTTGMVAIAFGYIERKHGEQRTKDGIREAVMEGWAFDVDTLQRVASEERLDQIAVNTLSARLKDKSLAGEVYADLRDQVIRSPERWHDVDVNVSLKPWTGGPATGVGSMFIATVRWEYKVVPASATMRFACVSDMGEYRELLRDQSIASAWHFDPSSHLDPASTDVFELLTFTVDGMERKIRRAERKGAQLYAVSLGSSANGDDRVTIAYTYRVLIQRHGHLLYLDLPRPTKGLHVRLDYTAAGIRRVNTLDYFASSQSSVVEHAPATGAAKTVNVSFDGWVFPRSGVAFVWVLDDEYPEFNNPQ